MQNVGVSGVIGGADGPTAIFLSGSGVTMGLLLGAAVLAVGVVAIIVYAARK